MLLCSVFGLPLDVVQSASDSQNRVKCSVLRVLLSVEGFWGLSVQCSVECGSACAEQLVFIVLGDGRPARRVQFSVFS
jgi:hypothetical protein